MKLMIKGKIATVGQIVMTCRGTAILLDWTEPSPLPEDNGEVIIKESGHKYAQRFDPCAINGKFIIDKEQ